MYELITILGPTASGKTNIASRIAEDFNGEIISADSRQVYKGMDIGTGKDLHEFTERKIRYHLIDIIEPSSEYNLFKFTRDFKTAYEGIKNRGEIPVMVGGTGLYLSAILQSYYLPQIRKNERIELLNELSVNNLKTMLIKLKPKLHNITDLNSRERLVKAILVEKSRNEEKHSPFNLNSLNIGIKTEREEINKRITKRLKERLSSGMIEEVEKLLQDGLSPEKLNYFGLEYKFVNKYISGELNYNDMFQKLNSAIKIFAKKQMTWFRKMEREGVIITWFRPNDYLKIKNYVDQKFFDENIQA